ncbi:MAG: flagellar hook-basal body complex protein FliE [Proteobacteria bacterium]|nr:MAG: flagellar hook-basal body complex protein FliE [Pseudomonadota bacterium]
MSSSLQVDAVLAQIRAMQSQIRGAAAPANQAAKVAAGAGLGPHKTTQVPGTPSFAAVMKQGIEHVNQAQQRAGQLAAQFERGVPGVELPQVMLEMQKASVSFRALTEVRNRFVSAYQEIMNMPI